MFETLFEWYLDPIFSLASHQNYLPIIFQFVAFAVLFYFYVRVKRTLLKACLVILLAWFAAFSYFFGMTFLTLPYLFDVVTSEKLPLIFFALQVVVPLVVIYYQKTKLKKSLLSKKDPSRYLVLGAVVLVLVITYFNLGRIAYLHSPFQEHFGTDTWYTLNRRSLLYSLKNIGMAYVNKDQGISLPPGYITTNRYFEINTSNTWFNIAGYDYVVFVLYLGITHALILLLLGDSKKK